MRLFFASLFLLCAVPAFAQAPGDETGPPPPPPPAPVMAPPPPVAPPPPAAAPAPVTELGTLEDANSGRVAIMPTALTPPKGAFSFEDYELFFVAVSYAPTDNLVLSATTMVPITSDLYWGVASAKLQVVRQGQLHVAVQAGAAGAMTKDTTTQYDAMGNVINETSSSTGGGGFDLGGVVTYCFDVNCYSHASAAAMAGFATHDNASVPVAFMGGIVAKLGSRVRLIAEADTAHLFGKINDQANGFIGWYGLRFTSKQIGVDLALVKPFCGNGDCDSSTFPLGFPFVAFSYRSL